jgi:hypothetical protein
MWNLPGRFQASGTFILLHYVHKYTCTAAIHSSQFAPIAVTTLFGRIGHRGVPQQIQLQSAIDVWYERLQLGQILGLL